MIPGINKRQERKNGKGNGKGSDKFVDFSFVSFFAPFFATKEKGTKQKSVCDIVLTISMHIIK